MHKHLRLTCYALLCLLVPIGVMAQTEHTYLDRALPGSWSEEGSDFQQTLPVEDNWWRNFKDPLLADRSSRETKLFRANGDG